MGSSSGRTSTQQAVSSRTGSHVDGSAGSMDGTHMSPELRVDRPGRAAGTTLPVGRCVVKPHAPWGAPSPGQFACLPTLNILNQVPRELASISLHVMYELQSMATFRDLRKVSKSIKNFLNTLLVRHVNRETQSTWFMVQIKYGPECFPCTRTFLINYNVPAAP